MRPKLAQRLRAVELRKQGLVYSEIRAQVPVAKSSLSLWLRDTPLSPESANKLAVTALEARIRRGQTNRARREAEIRNIIDAAEREAQNLLGPEQGLWLAGTALYWAEGSKPKEWDKSRGVSFTNMDPRMLLIFRQWLTEFCAVGGEDLLYSLYIHPSGNLNAAKEFWRSALGIPDAELRTYLKRHNPSPKRNNTGREYHGTMRIGVRRSTDLNYRINGWIQFIVGRCGVV